MATQAFGIRRTCPEGRHLRMECEDKLHTAFAAEDPGRSSRIAPVRGPTRRPGLTELYDDVKRTRVAGISAVRTSAPSSTSPRRARRQALPRSSTAVVAPGTAIWESISAWRCRQWRLLNWAHDALVLGTAHCTACWLILGSKF